MALLVEGEAMSPDETKEFLNFIRNHGITQFLNIWRRVKDLQGDELKFGDEVECGVFVVDNEKKTVKLSIRGAEVI
jgi:glutamate--cysteine ligase catalytic subunit